MNLTQEDKPVAKHEAELTKLSHYGLHFINDKNRKAGMFEKGLKLGI